VRHWIEVLAEALARRRAVPKNASAIIPP